MPPTRFALFSRPAAIAILIGFAIFLVCCIRASRPGRPSQSQAVAGLSDAEVMYHIVGRVHHGEGYYPAAAAELRLNGYGVRSVFNWRQPLYAWVLGRLPNEVSGRIILSIFTLIVIVLAGSLTMKMSNVPMAAIAYILVPGAAYGCFLFWGPVTLETVGGVMILLSVVMYARGNWAAGMGIALVALFMRELLAPYVIVCGILAMIERRPKEVIAWAVGLLCYAAYFAFHAAHVRAQILPTDAGYIDGWVQFNGLWFAVATAAEQSLLVNAPLWVTGIYFALALLGVAAFPGKVGRRIALTVVLYAAFFTVVGKSFNDYWGMLYTPLLAMGMAWTPAALIDLWTVASGKTNVPEQSPLPTTQSVAD